MRLRQISTSIRTRITLWNLAIPTLAMTIFLLSTQVFLWRQLNSELKATLIEESDEVARFFLKQATDGHFVWRGHQENSKQVYWIAVSHLDGVLIFRNFTQIDFTLPPITSLEQPRTFHTLSLPDGKKLLLIQEIRQIDNTSVVIRVGRTTDHLMEEMWHFFLLQAAGFPFVLLLTWVGGYFAAGRVLAPLQKIVLRMQAITAENLHERLPVEDNVDELGHLSLTFNHLLEKLEHSFTQMRQFTGDASHELRTPLAAMHSVGETAIREPLSAQGYQEAIASMLEECDRMGQLVSNLLALARADSDQVKAAREILDLGEVVREEIARIEILAEEKEQIIELTILKACPVSLDRSIFRQAFANILHNAIQYAPEKTTIQILVEDKSQDCQVCISDKGPGIAPEHQTRIFDRFYRVDKVRTRKTGSSGLGLAIADWAVRFHGGHIKLTSAVGQGSTFCIVLPYHKQLAASSAWGASQTS